MTVDQISIFLENTAGRLSEVTEILGAAGVDMRALSIADTRDFGILRIMVSDTDKALAILRAQSYIVSVNQVLAVKIEDKPGSLAKVLRILSDAAVSIEYVYAFISQHKGNAYVVFRVQDNDKAVALFEEHGIHTATKDEIYG